MHLTDQLNIRVEHSLKVEAEETLNKLGIKTGDSIRMFLRQVCLTQSLPLNVKVPNKKTIQAIEELERG
ncbi:MAG: type II toxin-antitoxin system RelB/DinJ family antitoxin [Neisseriaceae bacterium]